MSRAFQKGAEALGVLLTVMVLSGLLLFLVAGCTLGLAANHHIPRPPRRLTMEKAQRHYQLLHTQRILNRRYYHPL